MNRKSTTRLRKSNEGRFIGIYVGSSFFTIRQLLLDTVLTRCSQLGIFPILEVVTDEHKPPMSLFEGKVSGALVFGRRISEQNLHLKYNVPILYVNTNLRDAPGTVTFDEKGAVDLAVTHMMEKGKKHLAYIYCEREHYSADARLRGIVESCEKYRLPNPKVLKLDKELQLGVSTVQMLQILETFCDSNKKIDGMILSPDRLAPMCYKILEKKKKRIPKDISIVGFNNDILTRLISPRLTSLWPHYGRLGKEIVDVLLDRIMGGSRMEAPITVPYELLERETS